ncbi:hypothetical protein L484_006137 [Morus notabilis]|uniref:Uncharacterized protein n=1 Tax=Morus notabilis TaxID=981085 RepID=W9QCR2_9ROSA|nr:hypothetical protein L484_006137 [Morus notabilis]
MESCLDAYGRSCQDQQERNRVRSNQRASLLLEVRTACHDQCRSQINRVVPVHVLDRWTWPHNRVRLTSSDKRWDRTDGSKAMVRVDLDQKARINVKVK